MTVWSQDEAGPYQAIAQPSQRWSEQGKPKRYPHTYVRSGTAKMLSLFHSATGELHVKGVERGTNAILHPWLKEQIALALAALPEAPVLPEAQNRAQWESWREGLSVKFTLLHDPPPLRMLLIWDNLIGHWNAEMLVWLMQQGVIVLFTLIAGSFNLCESVQRIVVRRALQGQSFESPKAVMAALEAAAVGWNADPTPFEWGAKRVRRRHRARARREQHRLGGSGGFTRRPVRRRWKGHYSCPRGK